MIGIRPKKLVVNEDVYSFTEDEEEEDEGVVNDDNDSGMVKDEGNDDVIFSSKLFTNKKCTNKNGEVEKETKKIELKKEKWIQSENSDVREVVLDDNESVDLLYLNSKSVLESDKDYDMVVENNNAYKIALQRRAQMRLSKESSDIYTHRPANTFDEICKHKSVQTTASKTWTRGTQASSWLIYSAYAPQEIMKEKRQEHLLTVMARAIQLNNYQQEAAVLKNIQDDEEEEEEDGGGDGGDDKNRSNGAGNIGDNINDNDEINDKNDNNGNGNNNKSKNNEIGINKKNGKKKRNKEDLHYLFTFEYPRNEDFKDVICMCLNPHNNFLLAVSYGGEGHQKKGKIRCWSVKNISDAEILLETPCEVSCMHFHPAKPNLLAAGMEDGRILVYDVANYLHEPITLGGDHASAVRQVKWKETEAGNELLSTSCDGRVLLWTMDHVIKSHELFQLLAPQASSSGNKSNKHVMRNNSVLCVCFHPKTRHEFLIGCEDGTIYKCSTLSNHTSDYKKHYAAVNGLLWSEEDDDVFVSWSADWCILFWRKHLTQPITILQHSKEEVRSVHWLRSAHAFVSVCVSSIQIWNLQKHKLRPVFELKENDTFLDSCFSQSYDGLFVASQSRGLKVFKVFHEFE